MHDLFKLEVANAKKNVAWEPNTYQWENVEHCHFYHSVDKNGKAQEKCATINGHFHFLIPDPKDPLKLTCSEPMQYVMALNERGQKVKKAVPVGSHDTHTHEVTYIQSEEFQQRKINPEYLKLQQQQSKEPEKVPGIIG